MFVGGNQAGRVTVDVHPDSPTKTGFCIQVANSPPWRSPFPFPGQGGCESVTVDVVAAGLSWFSVMVAPGAAPGDVLLRAKGAAAGIIDTQAYLRIAGRGAVAVHAN